MEDGTRAADEIAALRASRQYETASRFSPDTLPRTFDLFARLDPQFAAIWLRYSAGLLARPQLDVRSRLLVLTGQYTMKGYERGLRNVVAAAIREDVDLKEVLEAILQCYVYGGEPTVVTAAEIFVDAVDKAGKLDEVAARGVLAAEADEGRSLETEREHWTAEDRADPRLPYLLDRYGWKGISNGLRLRPGQHVNLISSFDAFDADWCDLWLEMCFHGMYGRTVLDEKTRLLCVVGNCVAVGDTYQYPRHMLGALRAGATPRELLEVVLQSIHVVGHPMVLGIVVNDLMRLLDEAGRLAEVVDDPAKVEGLRRVVAARIAGRGTVADLRTADGRA